MTEGKVIANFVLNDLTGLLRKRKLTVSTCPIKPEVIGCLARLVHGGHLPKRKMRELVERWL